MWKVIGAIVVAGALVQSVYAQQTQQGKYYGPCKTAVMKKPGMTSANYGQCNAACGAAIRQCMANKGKI